MQAADLKKKIEDVIGPIRMASVATLKGNKPWVRYMMVQKDEDLNLYAATFMGARKVQQIRDNNNVHVTLGGDEKSPQAPYINIQGKAGIVTDDDTKKKYWFGELKKFFSGPEDPNFSLIKISPEVIEYMTPGSLEPEIYIKE
jgi:general stress protein 26